MIGSEYYFLFALAGVAAVFATVQDLKTREVANWLNFSFLAFALAYRAFYSAYSSNWMFLVYGMVGALVLFGIGNILYYSKGFGGGDAKLLMGFGAVLPIASLWDLIFVGAGFIFVLFSIGAIYNLAWSAWIASSNKKRFIGEFNKKWRELINPKRLAILILSTLTVSIVFASIISVQSAIFVVLGAVAICFLFIYLKAVDVCMIKAMNVNDLREGDWIEEEIKVGGRWIKKSAHGLSLEDIKILKKRGKKVLIKDGIPFIPAFLIAWTVMVFVFLFLQFPLWVFPL